MFRCLLLLLLHSIHNWNNESVLIESLVINKLHEKRCAFSNRVDFVKILLCSYFCAFVVIILCASGILDLKHNDTAIFTL